MKQKRIRSFVAALALMMAFVSACGKAGGEKLVERKTEAADQKTGQEENVLTDSGSGKKDPADMTPEEIELELAQEIFQYEYEEPDMKEAWEPAPEKEDTEQQKAVKEALGIYSEIYKKDIPTTGGQKYGVRARISVPETLDFYRVSVAPEGTTDGEVSKMIGEEALHQWTAEDEGELLYLEGQLANIEECLKKPEELSERERELLEEQKKQYAKLLEEQRAKAVKMEPPFTLSEREDKDGPGLIGRLNWNRGEMLLFAGADSVGLSQVEAEDSCTISAEEAKKYADEMIDNMGLSGIFEGSYRGRLLGDGRYTSSCHRFTYTRVIRGITVNDDAAVNSERIRIDVDDKGILSMEYLEPQSVFKIGENVELLSFGQLMAAFEEYFPEVVKRQNYPHSLVVTEFRLGYHCMEEDGKLYLVPAWTLYGYVEYLKDGVLKTTAYDDISGCGLMTINASDGTLIHLNANQTSW